MAQFELFSRKGYSSVPLDEFDQEEVGRPTRDRNGRAPNYIEIRVTEKDTLQGLSLQYRCPVSELKRINGISKDFELFARRKIKIPEKITLLDTLELRPTEHLSSRSSSNASDLTDDQPTNHKKVKKLLEKFDRKVSKAKSKANGYSAAIPLLDNEEINISEIAEEISQERIVIEREKKAFTYGIFRDILILFTVLGTFAAIIVIVTDVRWNMTDHSWNKTFSEHDVVNNEALAHVDN